MTLLSLAHAIGWTMLRSLWVGAVAAILLALALGMTRNARIRYAIACAAMLGMLAAFAISIVREMPVHAETPTASLHFPQAPKDRRSFLVLHGDFRAGNFMPYLGVLWIAGVFLLQIRSMASWIATRRLRSRGVCVAPEFWQRRLSQLRTRVQISQSVALLESCLTTIPMVAGYLRPVILIPIGMLAAMPAGQIEAILLHELAHVRRRDYLVNMLQIFAENLLFYHPAVWWMTGVIRAERENCCDDLVVATIGNAGEYASALAALEENRWAGNLSVLAANGGNLMKRIQRILYPLDTPRARVAPVLLVALLTITATFGLHAWQANPAPVLSKTDAYQKWLNEDVIYIMEAPELAAFANLTTDEERDMFIQQFWERRNPASGASPNLFREEHYRRIAKANQRYATTDGVAGWRTDRGRTLIVFGPPDELESHPAAGSGGAPYEEWLYYRMRGVGSQVIMRFVDKAGRGNFELTTR